MIKALILDFGGVVVTMPRDAPSACQVAGELGLPCDQLMAEVFGHEDWQLAFGSRRLCPSCLVLPICLNPPGLL